MSALYSQQVELFLRSCSVVGNGYPAKHIEILFNYIYS